MIECTSLSNNMNTLLSVAGFGYIRMKPLVLVGAIIYKSHDLQIVEFFI